MIRNKTLLSLGVSAFLCSPAIAFAQDPAFTPTEGDTTSPADAPPPPPPPPERGYRYDDRPVADSTGRPDTGFAYGVGLGWNLPTDLTTPNTASARIRFGSLAFEPFFNVGGRSGKTESETITTPPGGPAGEPDRDEDKTAGFDFGIGANVRYALASRGPVDLVGLGNATFSIGSATDDRNVDDDTQLDKTTTRRQNLSLGWGLGVEWFINRRIALSADATNPLISWTREKRTTEQETTVADQRARTESNNTTNNLTYGLTINPTVRAMVHLFF